MSVFARLGCATFVWVFGCRADTNDELVDTTLGGVPTDGEGDRDEGGAGDTATETEPSGSTATQEVEPPVVYDVLGQGTTDDELCLAPDVTPCDADSDDLFHAMGLGCPGPSGIPIVDNRIEAPDNSSWHVARQYGTYDDPVTGEAFWGPRRGEKFLFIGTGTVDPPDSRGVLVVGTDVFQPGQDNGNPDGVGLPEPINPQRGSNGGLGGAPFVGCDGVGDCSDTLLDQWTLGEEAAYDLAWFSFDVVVPEGTRGYAFDFAYFSSEFPEYVAPSRFNDIALWWTSGETFTGNITFVDGQPLTVTALQHVIFESGHWGDAAQLAGTGFEGTESGACSPQNPFNHGDCPLGGGTGWYTARGPAVPGETLSMTFAIFDMGDGTQDTAALIDNWRWSCQGCDPAREQCGAVPAG